MKIINLEQGSQEWLDYRKTGLGASDIAIISGTNPYKTPYQLWQIKCGFSEEDAPNKAMYHGMQYEPIARDWLNKNMDMNFEPLCVQDETREHFRASLDGFDIESRTLVEIKCPLNTDTLDQARENGTIHAYWIDQIQWQIMLSGAKEAFVALWDHRDNTCIVVRVFPDSSRILKLVDVAEAFWQHVVLGTPPELTQKDYQEVDSKELKYLLEMYAIEDIEEKRHKQAKESLKKQIIAFGQGHNMICSGHKIYLQTNPCRYDMDKMREDGIDLDKYKSKPTRSYRIKINNDKVVKFEENI